MSASAGSALNGDAGGGNNRDFLNAKPIPATFKFSSQTGLKLAKFKGTIEPLKYVNELFNAIKNKSYGELKDLHARFPLVIAELNRNPSPSLRPAVLIFGHDLLLVLRRAELAHQRGETYPSDPAVSNHAQHVSQRAKQHSPANAQCRCRYIQADEERQQLTAALQVRASDCGMSPRAHAPQAPCVPPFSAK